MDLLHTAHIPAGRGPFPTVLALHGWGANAHDLLGLARVLHDGDALFLCPQGPVELPSGPQAGNGYGWFPITEGGPPNPVDFMVGRNLLKAFLEDALDRYPVDRSKLCVLGFSQGGVMAFDLALESPETFKALIALSSWLPEEMVEGIEASPALAALPTLLIHGEVDPMIPVARAHESRERLEALGVHVAHGEYQMGHEIGQQALRDLHGWMEQNVFRPAPQPT
jgi:phospholipase/carboxylesterase